jgi:hypothetical protein
MLIGTTFLGFIFLIWLLLFRIKKVTPLNKEERALLYAGFIFGIIGVIFTALQWFNVTPASFAQYISIITNIVLVILGLIFLIAVVMIIRQYKRRATEILARKYKDKMQRKIKKELEETAKDKQLTVLQNRHDYLESLANDVAQNVSNGLPPTTYTAAKGGTMGAGTLVYVGKHGAIIPIAEAEIMAEKMNEINKSKKYRRNKVLFFLSP